MSRAFQHSTGHRSKTTKYFSDQIFRVSSETFSYLFPVVRIRVLRRPDISTTRFFVTPAMADKRYRVAYKVIFF